MKKAAIWILPLFLFLSACTRSSSNLPLESLPLESEIKVSADQEESTASSSEEVDFLTGDKFKQPSDFEISRFDLSYLEEENAISYRIAYSFGEDATRFITKGKHPYYFYLTVPEDVSRFFLLSQSEPVKGPELNGNNEELYEITLKLDLKNQLKESEIQQILNKPQNYVLYLYENEQFPARVIGNVYGWMQIK